MATPGSLQQCPLMHTVTHKLEIKNEWQLDTYMVVIFSAKIEQPHVQKKCTSNKLTYFYLVLYIMFIPCLELLITNNTN